MTCPKCGGKLKAVVVMTGGCQGHFNVEDRCYCSSQDVHVEFYCENSTFSGKKRCRQKRFIMGELGDQYAIGRWLTENYVMSKEQKTLECEE